MKDFQFGIAKLVTDHVFIASLQSGEADPDCSNVKAHDFAVIDSKKVEFGVDFEVGVIGRSPHSEAEGGSPLNAPHQFVLKNGELEPKRGFAEKPQSIDAPQLQKVLLVPESHSRKHVLGSVEEVKVDLAIGRSVLISHERQFPFRNAVLGHVLLFQVGQRHEQICVIICEHRLPLLVSVDEDARGESHFVLIVDGVELKGAGVTAQDEESFTITHSGILSAIHQIFQVPTFVQDGVEVPPVSNLAVTSRNSHARIRQRRLKELEIILIIL